METGKNSDLDTKINGIDEKIDKLNVKLNQLDIALRQVKKLEMRDTLFNDVVKQWKMWRLLVYFMAAVIVSRTIYDIWVE